MQKGPAFHAGPFWITDFSFLLFKNVSNMYNRISKNKLRQFIPVGRIILISQYYPIRRIAAHWPESYQELITVRS